MKWMVPMVSKLRKNHFQYKIGVKWVQEFFYGQSSHGYVIDTRGHDDERKHPHNGPSTEIAYKPSDIKEFIAQMESSENINNDLVIVRTFKEKGNFVSRYCYFVVISEKILKLYQNKNLYFRLEGKNGKADWHDKGRGLVRYFSMHPAYLDGDVPMEDISTQISL